MWDSSDPMCRCTDRPTGPQATGQRVSTSDMLLKIAEFIISYPSDDAMIEGLGG